jgi:probable HAF family extracellular repeat protein
MNRATHILSILAFFASIISAQALTLKYHVLAIAPGFAQGVNDKGDVVGTLTLASTDIYYQPKHAFLYKNGKTTDPRSIQHPTMSLP